MTDNTAVSTQHTHSLLPWEQGGAAHSMPDALSNVFIRDSTDAYVAEIRIATDKNVANAEYIVKCCNLFPELLSALHWAVETLETADAQALESTARVVVRTLREALDKARA